MAYELSTMRREHDIAFRLTGVNALHYLNRYMVPALLPALSLDLSLSHTQGGTVVSAFVLGYFLASPLFGFAGDRFSKSYLMRLSVFAWGVSTIGCAFPTTFVSVLLLRVLVGVGQAGFVTLAPPHLKDLVPDPRALTTALSYLFAAIPVGAALGYVAGGFFTDIFSWRIAFIIGGALTCVTALLIPKSLKTSVAEGRLPLSFKDSIALTIKSKPIMIGILGYALNTLALTSVAAFVPTYGLRFGFSLSEISTLFGLILVVTGLVGTVLGGRVVERLASKSESRKITYFRFTGATTLIAVPFFALSFWTSNHYVFLASCAAAELFVFAGVASLNAILVNECEERLVSFTQGATVFTINLLGALPGPIITGIIADMYGLPLAMQVTTLGLLGSGIVLLAGGRRLHT